MGIIYLPLNRIKDFIYYYKSYKKTKVQFTELLNYLILKKNKINTISYNSFWYEFDDIEDLKTFNKYN